MANNRELSQLASFVTINDTTKTISIGSTVASLNVAGVVTATSFAGAITASGVNVSGVGTITRLEATDINVSGASTVGVVTAIPFNTSNISIGRDVGTLSGGAGDRNVAIGQSTFKSGTGSLNVVIGAEAGRDSTTTEGNVLIGSGAGASITTGDNNVVLGNNAGQDGVFTFNTVGTAGTSNIIVMGNASHTKSYIQIDWTVTSDVRDKKIIGEVPLGLSFVQGLEPIKFQFKNRESGDVTDETLRYGFKAQQVAELEGNPTVIADVADPENLKVTSAHLVPVLVNAIKELSAKVAELETRLDAQ